MGKLHLLSSFVLLAQQSFAATESKELECSGEKGIISIKLGVGESSFSAIVEGEYFEELILAKDFDNYSIKDYFINPTYNDNTYHYFGASTSNQKVIPSYWKCVATRAPGECMNIFVQEHTINAFSDYFDLRVQEKIVNGSKVMNFENLHYYGQGGSVKFDIADLGSEATCKIVTEFQ